MVCDYFIKRNGKVFCKAYGRLEEVSQEKILECESNFATCLEGASEFLKREKYEQKGVGTYFISGPLE